MANIIRIKRSSVTGNPGTLAAGELAYSGLTEDGSPNGGDRLYIGMGSETGGNAANHFVIGGKYFTDMMDHTRGTLTANSAILTDANNKIDQIKVGNMTFTGSTNTIISANTDGNLNLTPNGTGSVVVSKIYVTGTTTFNDNVLPTGNGAVDLGSATHRFNKLYLAGATIDLGGQTISANTDGIALTSINSTPIGNVTPNTGAFTTISATANANVTGNLNVTANANVSGNLNVSSKSNLGAIGNVKITGGSSGQFLQTDGAGNLSFASFTVEAGSSIVNGTSNVSVALNGNITFGVGGNAGVATVTSTGNVIVGNILAGGFFYSNGSAFSVDSANLVNGSSNVKTAASGNVTVSIGGTANVLTVTGTGIVTGNANIGNLGFSGTEIASTITDSDISLNPNGTGNINVNNAHITNLHEPTNDSDAATKLYVDTVAQGLHIHAPAQVATQANLATITGDTVTYDNGSSGVGATLTLATAITAIDGVTYPTTNVFVTGSRIIVKDEANAHHNGIYTINAAGTVLTRATDFDSITEIHGGDFIFVEHGTLYRSTGWVQNQNTVTVGGSDIDFLQFAGAGTYTAGSGLALNGTEFSIATSYVGQSSITTLGNVTTGTWSANAVTYAYGGTGFTTYAKGDIVYADNTNSLAKLTAATNGQVLQLSSGLPVWGDLDGGTY